jgi:hypothetical protein
MTIKTLLRPFKNLNIYFADRFGFRLDKRFERPSINFAKTRLKKKGLICAEIGTFKAGNALRILKTFPVKKLYVIDPWTEYSSKYLGDKKTMATSYRIAMRRLKKWIDNGVVEVIRDYSDNAAKKVPGNLDFVYVDGDHSYKFAKNDMKNYFKKLRKGGVMGGHDIVFTEVARAFCEFVSDCGSSVDPYIENPDWWIFKK